jgi:hypothetical protein
VVLGRYQEYLSPFELEEIKQYPQIFYFGQNVESGSAGKIRATLDNTSNNYGTTIAKA